MVLYSNIYMSFVYFVNDILTGCAEKAKPCLRISKHFIEFF